eukprot:CAMPEP_0174980020 /NCGR_PEP_ID=MMETSP0004_2-20121128/15122_1 /TAXON_ID=420556 /ORGANISM="Ochromonas sp., Strain CCMP1393" /LENGTH=303 /DNA_ID=CAMNT_0016231647 /DNA_START=56 /DNA_END=967 /DNA_ORIENTATION=+
MSLKYAIVTGGNAGMGLAVATELCKLDFHVTISVRSESKGDTAVSTIKDAVKDAKVDYLLMDMGNLETVKEFSTRYLARGNPLHLLINNAGIMNTPFKKTVDGYEEQFQVNHLSHFLLTHYLLAPLRAGVSADGNSRVVNLSSRAHLRWNETLNMEEHSSVTQDTYNGWRAYGCAKTCNILFTKHLAQLFPLRGEEAGKEEGRGIIFNALHPGLVNTGLLTVANLSESTVGQSISIEEGIKTTMWLATSPEAERLTGGYYFECKLVEGTEISSWAQSPEEAKKLFDGSFAMCGIGPYAYGSLE